MAASANGRSPKRVASPPIFDDGEQEMAPILDNTSGSLSVRHQLAAEASCGEAVTYDETWREFIFQWPTGYQELIDLSWAKLVVGAAVAFSSVISSVGVLHLLLCWSCGAKSCSLIASCYYAVVSIVANGGYEGEDPAMMTAGTQCFTGRTFLTWATAFAGLIIAGTLTAVMIGRAARHTSLRHRVHFSTRAVVRRLPAPDDTTAGPLVLQTRVATSHHRPLINVEVSMYAIVNTGSADDTRVYTQDLPFTFPEGAVPPRDFDATQKKHFNIAQVRSQSASSQRIGLWYPATLTHCLEHPDSPLRSYVSFQPNNGPGAEALAHNVQIVVQVVATDPINGANIVARNVYSAHDINCSGSRFDDRGLVQRRLARRGGGDRALTVNIGRLSSLVADDPAAMN